MQLDLFPFENAFERLNGCVMTSGLKSNSYRNIRQIFCRSDLRFRRHHDAARQHGISAGKKASMTGRRGHIDRPVTGGADVASPALLDRLISAFDLILR